MKMISEVLWNQIKKELPKKKSYVGRPEMDPRKALDGIFYVLKTGVPWHYLPRDFGKPTTVHCKFRKWVKLGVFRRIMQVAKKHYMQNAACDTWFAIDASFSKSPHAEWSGRNPTDRGRQGVKKCLVVDWNGAPIATSVGPANKHDSQFCAEILKDVCTRKRVIVAADSAFDSKKLRTMCKRKNIVLFAATNRRRNKNIRPIKPSRRWVVERTFGWLHWYRSLKTCWAKTKSSFLAMLDFACSIQLFKMAGIFV